MIHFSNWTLTPGPEVIARQYDDLSRTLVIDGDIPVGWTWDLLVHAGEAMDIIRLSELAEGGIGVTLTAQQLSLSGAYQLQLRGTSGNLVRHSNIISVFIPASLSGDEQWPEVPSEFSQLEQRVNVTAARAESAALNPPILSTNLTWKLWNPETGIYEDTGIRACCEAPFIGENGNWYINAVDTTISAIGIPGVSPTVSVTDIDGGHRLTFEDINGSKVVDVMDGKTVIEPTMILTVGTSSTANYVCTGENDQDVFQAAIAALPDSGGIIRLYPADYYFSGPVNAYGKHNVTITALDVTDPPVLHRTADWNGGIFSTYKPGFFENRGRGWHFLCLKFSGDPACSYPTVHYGIRGSEGDWFESCEFEDWQYGAIIGTQCRIIGCHFRNNTIGVNIPRGATISGCHFSNNYYGILQPDESSITNNVMLDNQVGIGEIWENRNIITGNMIRRGNGTAADYTDKQHTIKFGRVWLEDDIVGTQSTQTSDFGKFNVIYGNRLYGKDITIYAPNGASPGNQANLETTVIGENAVSAQPDWAQNDSSAADYVKNRTHWSMGVGVLGAISPETAYSFSEYMSFGPGIWDLVEGESYKVIWDNTEYDCVCFASTFQGMDVLVLGNGTLFGDTTGNDEPFAAGYIPAHSLVGFITMEGDSHTAAIYRYGEMLHKLDNKYLDLDWLPAKVLSSPVALVSNLLRPVPAAVDSNGLPDTFTLISGSSEQLIREGQLATVVWDGTEYQCEVIANTYNFGTLSLPCLTFGNHSLLSAYLADIRHQNEPFLFIYMGTADAPDVRALDVSSDVSGTYTISVAVQDNFIPVLPEECLPQRLSKDGLILNSSTAGSTKKFKITVDDTGSITATEITA